MAVSSGNSTLEHLYRRVSLRVAPPLILLYFVAFLDRVNIGFAALMMNRDLGISDKTYGLAAGIFFVGYLLLAIPSNLMLVRVGALRWIGVLMISWGFVSGAMAFVHGPVAYVVLRFLLGAAESGFFPGIVYYLTGWLPGSARAGLLSLFYFAVPLSNVVGSPISAALLRMNGWHGLAGWQWLFLVEALPAVLLGVAVPWLMSQGVETAPWLAAHERYALAQAIAREGGTADVKPRMPPLSLLAGPAIAYLTISMGLYELGFWTPRLLASHGIGLRSLGWLNAVPYAVAGIGMLLWSALSDRLKERRWTLFISWCTAALGFLLAAYASSTPLLLVALSIAAFGVFGTLPVFWAAASQRLPVAGAALGIAAINSVGNLGGFAGPYATGWLLDRTHTYTAGLLASAVAIFLGALLAVWVFADVAKQHPNA